MMGFHVLPEMMLLFLLLLLLLRFSLTHGNEEAETLMAMKSALDPDNRLLGSWTKGGDPCSGEFQGVACNENGKVANISLQGKGLSGSVPAAISGLKSLTGLYLHYNSLTGPIPKELSNLTLLTDLYLNVNSLSGSIPPDLGSLPNLQALELCCNQLTGSIPKELGSLKKLNVLALQHNHLRGAIPASLGEISQLTRLDLSFNLLFGSIPGRLTALPLLNVLDVRNNTLSGNVPTAFKRLNDGFQYGNNSDLCGADFLGLQGCKSSDLQPIRPDAFGPDSTPNGVQPTKPESVNVQTTPTITGCEQGSGHCSSRSSKSPEIAIVMAVVAVTAGMILGGLLLFSWYRRRKQKIGSAFEPSDSRLSSDQVAKDFSITTTNNRKSASPLISLEYANGWDPLAEQGGSSLEGLQSFRFNLEEVESATQYFSDVNLLGKSSFAAVYRGMLRDGSVVALKSINKTSCKTEEVEFLKGLKILTSLRHENLVGLRGFCCSKGRGECFLVYDFMPNGTLARYLDGGATSGRRVLDWPTRVKIINGIAKGIEYLHGDMSNKPALVHQNISAEKVLLDHHFNPRLSDSGQHKLLADDVVFSTLKGCAAMGYLAPEYTTVGRFTDKSDVYAFGVLVLHVLAGKATSFGGCHLAESGNLGDLMDPNLKGNYSKEEATHVVSIALRCTSEAPSQRPTMSMVVQELTHQNLTL
ncbi:somatic embryogenesis receptor kinase 1 [Amborella trichopoda]|nr:somatic embryogenesis receptor kinase 1 [Amborella trichopoda]|eukprot:XP_006857826.2 somatic embryogenesis receptor kinase 1 [Amborella trichopoda]